MLSTTISVRPISQSDDSRAAAAAINKALGDSGDSSWLSGDAGSEARCRAAAAAEIASCHPAIRSDLRIEIESTEIEGD